MRVGRAALDEEAIRLIEARNPGVQFDWPRILKGSPTGEDSGDRRSSERPRSDRRPMESRPAAGERPTKAPAAPRPAELAAPVASEEPATFESPPAEEPTGAAYLRLGPEGLVRLRGRHAAMLARIDERTEDEVKRAQLKELAERLNPDSWVTDDDVRAGLENYETTFEQLRNALGGRSKVESTPDPGSEPPTV